MKYRNKTEQELIILGRSVKAGETFESVTLIENPNFETVEESQAPVAPQAAVQPAPVTPVAPVTPAPAPVATNEGATS